VSQQSALERIINSHRQYESNTFYKALQLRMEKAELDILKEIGDGTNLCEGDIRFLQGIREGLRRAKALPSKFINEIEVQIKEGK